MDCSFALQYVKAFFTGQINPTMRDKIIKHLMQCNRCKSIYTKYAKSIGLDFDIVKYAYTYSTPEDFITDAVPKKYAKVFENDENKYTDLAKTYNIEKLMAVKAFSDFAIEYDPKYDNGSIDYTPFYKFMTVKICQRIDHLERCYKLEYKDKVEG